MLRADHIPEPPLEPPEERHPRCPVCGEECDTFFENSFGEILGCEACIDIVDAWESEKED